MLCPNPTGKVNNMNRHSHVDARRWTSPFLAALGTLCVMCGPVQAQSPSYGEMEDACPVLDAPPLTWAEVHVSTVFPAYTTVVEKDTGMTEIDAWGDLFYVENDLGADLQGRIRAHFIMLTGFDDVLSYGLTIVQVPLQYSQRFEYGWGLRMDIAPGLHAGGTEFSDAWTAPVSAIAIHNFNSHVALYGGATARIGFDRVVDPRLGICFTTRDRFRFDLAYPESLMSFRVSDRFSLVAGARYWNQLEFTMGDDPRERLGLTEARAQVGFDVGVTSSSALSFRMGYAFNRSMWFRKEMTDLEMDDALSLQIGWMGLF